MTIDRSNAGSDAEHELPRLTRRRLLALTGGTVGTGLLTASGVAHADLQPQDRETLPQAVAAVLAGAPAAPAATTMAPLAGFQQAAQSGFVPVNSSLTFGAPTDLASGWDGTVWAIDGKGAHHLYDPLSDGWQLHGTGIDGAALIEGQGPAVYFRGGEVFIADGQHTAQALFTVWPDLPPSYQLGVQGAAWADDRVVLFRGGTYLTAPWPPPALASSQADATPTAEATPATEETPTAAAGTSAPTQGTPAATPSPASTPSPTAPATDRTPTPTAGSGPSPTPDERVTPEPAAASRLYHAALLPAAAAASSPSPTPPAATSTPTHAAPSATPAGHTPTPIATPTARATSTPPAATPTPATTPSPAASATGTPAPTDTPIPTDTSTPPATDTAVATDTPTAEATPTSTPTATSIASAAPLADYVPVPLTGVPGWPQTANWQDGVIDGVYSVGGGGVGAARPRRGGRRARLPGPRLPRAAGVGPAPLSTIPDFAPLPADWQANGFDAGFFAVGGPAAGSAYVTRGAQAMVYRLQVGADGLATPTPVASGTPEASLTPASSETPEMSPTAEGTSTAEATPTAESSPTTQATSTPALTATTAPTSTRPAAPSSGGAQAGGAHASTPLYHAALAAAVAASTVSSTPTPQVATATATPRAAASSTATQPPTTPSATPTLVSTPTTATTPTVAGSPTAEVTPTGQTTTTTTPTPTPSSTPNASATGDLALLLGDASNAELHYIAEIAGDWPSSWHPRFQHAPNGRTSGLWGATVEGHVVSFDGTRWTRQPGDATSVAAGVDGSIFAVGQQDPQQLFQWHGSGWSPIARHSSALAQVSVGDQGLVWARDSGNGVHQLAQGQLQPVAQLGSAAHLAANYDGTLWSCTGADSHALRLASDLNAPPAAVPAAATVQKVASTGFGTAHCLTAQNGGGQVYRYDSPYVFRTPGTYVFSEFTFGAPIEQGLGSLFFSMQSAPDTNSGPTPTYQVVALDAHTGQELSRSAAAPSGLRYTPPVFDPIHETVIVGLTANYTATSPQPGRLLGLDARDLRQVRWSLALPNNRPLGPGRPTLQGTQLCVSDNFNTLVMYDTGATPAASTPTYRWTFAASAPPQGNGVLLSMPPPVIANGMVYAAQWWYGPPYPNLILYLVEVDASTGLGPWNQPNSIKYFNPPPPASSFDLLGQFTPLLATLPGAQPGQSRQMLFANGGSSVWGIELGANSFQSYDLPGNSARVQSGFAFANGQLWFGDSDGTLYGLNDQLKAVANTPAPLGAGGAIDTTPIVYTDAQGLTAVLLSVANATQPGLLVFDPTSGNTISVPTQGTTFSNLSGSVSNGVVYGGGAPTYEASSDVPVGQVFGIRVDEAVQELRDFVVDSQLMQDFDDPSQPTHNANGVARYQTQLTLVDDTKAPLANTAVKLWADVANTTVLINGQSYTLGPDDDQYAAVKTGTDGTLVIASGSTQADGSDKADPSAVPLRAWAPFMDPYERMLVYRDREFHNRVASAHATDAGQAGADDPTRANLQTAQTYGDLKNQGKGTSNPLFTDQEKQDKQPQNVASAIQRMTGSVGTAPPKTSKRLAASWSLHAVDTPGKYVPYPDTPGAQYSPVNVAADRAAVVLQPGGLSYASSNDGSAPSAYADLSPAEATLAIDALDGHDWHSSQYAPPRVQAAAQAGTLSRQLVGRLLELAQGCGRHRHPRHHQRGRGYLRRHPRHRQRGGTRLPSDHCRHRGGGAGHRRLLRRAGQADRADDRGAERPVPVRPHHRHAQHPQERIAQPHQRRRRQCRLPRAGNAGHEDRRAPGGQLLQAGRAGHQRHVQWPGQPAGGHAADRTQGRGRDRPHRLQRYAQEWRRLVQHRHPVDLGTEQVRGRGRGGGRSGIPAAGPARGRPHRRLLHGLRRSSERVRRPRQPVEPGQAGRPGTGQRQLGRGLPQAGPGRAAAHPGPGARRRPGRDQRLPGWAAGHDHRPGADHVRPEQRAPHRGTGHPGVVLAVSTAIRRAADHPQCRDADHRHSGHHHLAHRRGPVAGPEPGRHCHEPGRAGHATISREPVVRLRQCVYHRRSRVPLRLRRCQGDRQRAASHWPSLARRQHRGVDLQHPELH